MANVQSPIRRYFLPAILILLHVFIFFAVRSSKQFANLHLERSSLDDRNSRLVHARDTATPGDVISVAEAKELVVEAGFITNNSSPSLNLFNLSSSVRNQTAPGRSLFNTSSSQSLYSPSSAFNFSSDSLTSPEVTDTETNSTKHDIINIDSPELNLSATYRVEYIAGVNGTPGSFSQTASINANGQPTTLPIWFDIAGSAVTVVGLAGAILGHPPPPPPGFVPLGPDADGLFKPLDELEDELTDQDPIDDEEGPQEEQDGPEELSSSSMTTATSTSFSTSTSSAATDAPIDTPQLYQIFPKSNTDPNNVQFTNQLITDLGEDGFQTAQTDLFGLVFWAAPLTQQQVATYQDIPLIEFILKDEAMIVEDDPSVDDSSCQLTKRSADETIHSRFKESSSYDDHGPHERYRALHKREKGRANIAPSSQAVNPADPDLIFLSKPEYVENYDLPAYSYVFDHSAGKGITVMVWDTGANPLSPDYILNKGTKDWLLINPYYSGARKWVTPLSSIANRDDDVIGHGTAMVSKAVGGVHGVARAANLVVVRVPLNDQTQEAQLSFSNEFWSILQMSDYISHKNLQGKVVISRSISTRPSDPEHAESPRYLKVKTLMQQMIDNQGVVFVCSSGNARLEGRDSVDTVPALWESELDLMVVGAVDGFGNHAIFSQGKPNELTVSTDGVASVVDASRKEDVFMTYRSRCVKGTSVATAAIAGLAAYFMAHPVTSSFINAGGPLQVPKNVKSIIKSYGYERQSNGYLTAFNGENWVDWDFCDILNKRDGSSSTAPDTNNMCMKNASSSSSSTADDTQSKPSSDSLTDSVNNMNATNPSNITGDNNNITYSSSNITSTAPIPEEPASLHQLYYNTDGSGLCHPYRNPQWSPCVTAYNLYNDTQLYTAYTSMVYTPTNGGKLFDSNGKYVTYVGLDGCAAMLVCDDDAAYGVGMTGDEIKWAFDYLFDEGGAKDCGSLYLSNRHVVTLFPFAAVLLG